MFKYMIKELKKSQMENRKFVPYGRLLSIIFQEGGILSALKDVGIYDNQKLGAVTGKIINGATLVNMRLISTCKKLDTDMHESDVISDLVTHHIPICKKEPMDVQRTFIMEFYKSYKKKIDLKDVPEEMYGGALPVAKGRKSKKKQITKEEYLADDATEKGSEQAASEKPLSPKKKREAALQTIRRKRSSSSRNLKTGEGRSEQMLEELEENWDEEPSPKKAKKAEDNKPSVMPMFVPSEEELQYAKDYISSEKARLKQQRQQKKREEQLKAAGNAPEPEVSTLITELEKETIQHGVTLISQALKNKQASGATSSDPSTIAPEAPQFLPFLLYPLHPHQIHQQNLMNQT
ncbi:hypothetical protein MTR_6g464400 [Medicago truncatula]|uniref:Uncharacterized protein n=1 Tax=Medicago truncatula TaxID=3880 RepID=A0A072UAU9_MEDTR|nr:hypothetical protein MTR_6g464400 [Medicago truncatula]